MADKNRLACDDTPCRGFYNQRDAKDTRAPYSDSPTKFGGGGRCYCNEMDKPEYLAASMNNHYWQVKPDTCKRPR